MSRLSVVMERTRVELGECRLDSDVDMPLGEAWASLSEAELERAARFAFAVDRDRFVRSHGYLRRRLGTLLGVPPCRAPIIGANGDKPHLAGGELRFSLSHSGDHAVVAIARDVDVGVDLELYDRSGSFAEQLDDLARFCLLNEEQDALEGLPAEQKVARFLSFWTAKEARMKLTGEGMSLQPKSIALALRDGVAIGYRRPRETRAALKFAPLFRADAICCVAVADSAAT